MMIFKQPDKGIKGLCTPTILSHQCKQSFKTWHDFHFGMSVNATRNSDKTYVFSQQRSAEIAPWNDSSFPASQSIMGNASVCRFHLTDILYIYVFSNNPASDLDYVV